MLFNSLEFLIFLPIVFSIYWLLSKDLKTQNLFLLASSYFFYGWWDWRFLFLIAFSSLIDYIIGKQLHLSASAKRRKWLLAISVSINLGFLGLFKYYNFFIDSFAEAFTLLGFSLDPERLDIVLPIGISFYTFQTLSYSIDVFRRKLKPSNDILSFFAFVSFFPQLVAGPIERATNLLPQFNSKRIFDRFKAIDGLRQILWGLFKKVVIADNCADLANQIFNHSSEYSGSTLLFGAVMFAFQIYGDFSGYSDIAIGTARLFGFSLMKNFAFPYFSRDMAEFWRRWHISLSTWFRDYLYIPLGGSRGSRWESVRNTFIIFTVSGFWHGANWTFVFWGILNAIYFLPLLLLGKNRVHIDVSENRGFFPFLKDGVKIIRTFFLTVIAWIFFRSENVGQAFSIFGEIFSISLFESLEIFPVGVITGLAFFLMVEWFNRTKEFALQANKAGSDIRRVADFVLISVVFWSIVIWHPNKELEFIYFQF